MRAPTISGLVDSARLALGGPRLRPGLALHQADAIARAAFAEHDRRDAEALVWADELKSRPGSAWYAASADERVRRARHIVYVRRLVAEGRLRW